ncbi:MAG: PleD family two-component system response regulator [Nostoc sp.]|uniref:PleD family two-component system response regulator n=1 Tax=Nostoc sp. TaxID=1180 RepID=UPI002FFB6DE7
MSICRSCCQSIREKEIIKTVIQTNQILILIIDYEAIIRKILRLYLEQEGYQIVEAQSGTEALSIFEKQHPDIVILDTILPDMDGFECCIQLQSLDESKCTPILMIADIEDDQSVDRAFEMGAIDYFTKPIHLPMLRQRIKRILEQSQLQKKLIVKNLELQRLVIIDELTQVANRRGFEEYLAQEWQRMAREQQPFSLIIWDVDFFKSYNDTYGHLSGDRCLKEIAKTIKNFLKRSTDLIARYGGEEFAAILPNTDVEGATSLAQTICSAIRTLAIPHRNSLVSSHVTLSAGLATAIPSPGSDFEQIILAADQSLYQAKAAGRNRFLHNSYH